MVRLAQYVVLNIDILNSFEMILRPQDISYISSSHTYILRQAIADALVRP